MANKTVTAEQPVAKPTAIRAASAPTYTVDEFAAAPKSLDAKSPDIVRAAFMVAGVKEATVEEAKKIVSDFGKKGVNK